jgi:hypothetical protein
MIRSPSPDRVIRTFPQWSPHLGGESGFRQSTFERLGVKLRDRGTCASSCLEPLSLPSLSKSLFTKSPGYGKVSSKCGFWEPFSPFRSVRNLNNLSTSPSPIESAAEEQKKLIKDVNFWRLYQVGFIGFLYFCFNRMSSCPVGVE